MRKRGMDKILVVDDDETILKLLKMRLEATGYQVFTASQSQEALKIVETEAINLALVDLKLNGENGIDLMKNLHKINPILPIIILTAFGTVKTAVEAMSKGAFSYLTKPFDNDELLLQIRNCLDRNRLSVEVKKLRGIIKERYGFDNIVGKSEKMKTVLELVAQAAETDSIVYVCGESGTCIWQALEGTGHLFPSIVQPSLRHYWRVSCLAMKKGHLQVLPSLRKGSLHRRIGALSFWMKYQRCP
jgi:two-component system response regulator GlrR